MKVAGLFAGIGGLELGLSRAGHETVFFCENSEPAQAVLRARFPGTPILPDDEPDRVGDIDHLHALPDDVDLVCAGFPCQDLSQAGRTIGIDGARSGLVGKVFELLKARSVPWVLLENVPFMLQLDAGRAMDRLATEFERLGYGWAYRIVNSLAFGLPQRRERVIFLAVHSKEQASPADVLFADETTPPEMRTALGERAHGFYWTEGTRGLGWAVDSIPTLKNGSTVGIPSPPAVLLPDGRIIKPHIEDAERLQGFDAGWTEPAAEQHRPSLRWTLIGNAVSTPVARWVGDRLQNPHCYDEAPDRDWPKDGRWPKAAHGRAGRRRAVQISSFPIWLDRLPLDRFLRHVGKEQHLSSKATAGFLRRLSRSSLRADGARDHLLALVQAHLRRMREQERDLSSSDLDRARLGALEAFV
ncbi:MAG: DNA cytosine methyltransferase [Rhizobiales bacterium]|nr:DNA cytosine methyltransferase [Hyphomicrobiales bacterium]